MISMYAPRVRGGTQLLIAQERIARLMNFRLTFLALSMASLAACAQSPMAGSIAEPAAAKASVSSVGKLPTAELNGQLLYQILLAEIAAQRGGLKLSADAYMDLAEKIPDPRIARRGAEVALRAQQIEPALKLTRLWVDLEPESLKGLQTLVSLQVATGRLMEAKPYIATLMKVEGRSPGDTFLRLHSILLRGKNKIEVLDLVTDLAKNYPTLPEAHLAIAQSAWHAGRNEQALRELDESERLKPGWETAALFRGQVLEKAGDADMLAYWQTFLRKYPNAQEVRLALAKGLARVGKYPDARTEFEALIQVNPDNPETYFAVGLLASQMNDLEAAEAAMKTALERGYPEEGRAMLYMGQISEARERYEEALKWYGDVVEPEFRVDARIKQALLLGKLKKTDSARAVLQEISPASDAERVRIIQTEARLLREIGDFSGSYAVLDAGLGKLPEDPELLYDRAMAAEKLGRLDVLERDLRMLIKLQPNHAHAHNALGYTLADRTNRLSEAISLLEQALKLSPEDPFILDSVGWANFKAKRFSEAEKYLRRAYAGRNDPEIAAHLGEVLWVKGDRAEAARVWQGALKSNPDNEALLETVSRLKP